ncbi:guanine nucleotide exchange factor [Anaeramoeba flamelloides]|uniref:Guanine nucleotide exchange factor n=1 Tax=Anaeramoeba flamelloides TaxID=1746091 RepID=A0AAV7ZLZ3_9EUKA|nr:guanine nucleotide exchange factor [Anaeramoeba flamelloides]
MNNEDFSTIKKAPTPPTRRKVKVISDFYKAINEGDLESTSSLFTKNDCIELDQIHEGYETTALGVCSRKNLTSIGKYLLEQGASVGAITDHNEETNAFHDASRWGSVSMLKLLYEYEPDLLSKRDNKGKHAVHHASISGKPLSLMYLISHCGVSYDLKDSSGFTPLLYASKFGSISTIKMLMKIKNENETLEETEPEIEKDLNGFNAMHQACSTSQLQTLRYLAKSAPHLADEFDNFQRKPVDIAINSRSLQCANYLSWMKKIEHMKASMGKWLYRLFALIPSLLLLILLICFKTFNWFFAILISGVAILYISQQSEVRWKFFHKPIKSPFAFGFHFALQLFITLQFLFILWPSLASKLPKTCFFYFIVHALVAFSINFLIKSDPGIIKQNNFPFENVLENSDNVTEDTFCSTCQCMKPKRSLHDPFKGKCVENFQVYCPMLYQTFGKKNIKYYFFFLCLVTIQIFVYSKLAINYFDLIIDLPQSKHLSLRFIFDFMINSYKLAKGSMILFGFVLVLMLWVFLSLIQCCYVALSNNTIHILLNWKHYSYMVNNNRKINPFDKGVEQKLKIRLPNGKLKQYRISLNKTTANQFLEHVFRSSEEDHQDYGIFCCFRSTRRDIFDDFEGEFLQEDIALKHYSDQRLQIRKRSKEEIHIEVSDEINTTQVTTLNFKRSSVISEVLSDLFLSKTKKNYKIGQSENNNSSVRNFGLVLENKNLQQSEKPIFIPLKSFIAESTPEQILKRILRKTDVFGIWLEASDYPLENYLSALEPLGYSKLSAKPKPIPLYINIPDSGLVPVIVDTTIKIGVLSKKFCDYFALKQKLHSKKLFFSLFHIIYSGDQEEKNSLIAYELIILKDTLSIYQCDILPMSNLKLIPRTSQNSKDMESRSWKLTHLSHSKRKRKVINDNLNLWEEMGSKSFNLIWQTDCNDNKGNKNKNKKKKNKNNDSKLPYQDRIRAASFNRTVSIISSPKTYNPELALIFIETLLLLKQEQFIEKLIQRFHVPSNHPRTNKPILKHSRNQIQLLVAKILVKVVRSFKHLLSLQAKETIKTFTLDVLQKSDKKVIECGDKILKILQSTQIERQSPLEVFGVIEINVASPESPKKQSKKKKLLGRKKKNKKKKDNDGKKLQRIKKGKKPSIPFIPRSNSFRRAPQKKNPESIRPKETDFKKLKLTNIHTKELARQLSLYTYSLYSKINTKELFDKAWCSNNREKLSPNVVKLIDKFNRVADLVSTEILMAETFKKRAKLIERVIQVGMYLREMNNFEDLVAVLSGLETTPVNRLHASWKRVPSTYLNQYKKLTKEIRLVDTWRLKQLFDECHLPAIPYLGIFLTDITYIADLPVKVENGLLNWIKLKRFYRTVEIIKRFQIVPYNFSKIDVIQDYFLNSDVMNDSEKWEKSLSILPNPNKKF